MITLIGTSTTIVGFGLCGIKDIREVNRKTTSEEILDLVRTSEFETIMIDEYIYEKIKVDVQRKIEFENKIFVKIPDRYTELSDESNDDIDDIVRDTIGINIKQD